MLPMRLLQSGMCHMLAHDQARSVKVESIHSCDKTE